jgi:O-antigen/teichoic acid export membrane protein
MTARDRRPGAEVVAQDEGVSRRHIARRLVENSGLIVAARAVTASLSLATIPVVVARLGLAGYGVWEALLAMASLAGMFQSALTGTLVWRVSAAYGARDGAEIRRLSRVGAGATLTLAVLLWPVAWLLRDEVVRVLRVPPEFQASAALAFPVVAGLVLLGGLAETLESVVNGCQRSGLVNTVGAIGLTANYAVVIVAIGSGAGLWGLVAGQGAGFLVRLLGAWAVARHAYSPVSLVPALPRRSDAAAARYSGLILLGYLTAGLRDQTDKLVLATMASASWVGFYGIAARLSGLVLEVSRFFYVPMLTAAGALNASSDWAGVRQLYSRIMAVVSSLTGGILVVTAGLAGHLVVLWMGRPIPEVPPLIWILIAGNSCAVILTGPGTALCRGIGRVDIETRYVLVNGLCNVGLTIALVLLIGARGTVVATGMAWALSSVVFALLLHQHLELPVGATWRAAGTALVAAAVACAAHFIARLFAMPLTRHEVVLPLTLLASAGLAVYGATLVGLRLVPVNAVWAEVRRLRARAA